MGGKARAADWSAGSVAQGIAAVSCGLWRPLGWPPACPALARMMAVERGHMAEGRVERAEFECANPILCVANMSRSVRYYVDVLGFTNAEWGSDDFTCVTRDTAAIYLSEGDQGQPGTWAWIGVSDVEALHDEYKNQGCHHTPRSGELSLGVRDEG